MVSVVILSCLFTSPVRVLKIYPLGDVDCGCLSGVFADTASIIAGLVRVQQQYTIPASSNLTCHVCQLSGLSELGLHLHFPLYHATCWSKEPDMCPVCRKPPMTYRGLNYAVHLHNEHGNPTEREPPHPAFAAFAWVVVHDPTSGRFLLVNEPAPICSQSGGRPAYWLPAGRIDAGETCVAAAVRETREEAGVAVRVTGLLHISVSHGTPRVVLLAEPEPLIIATAADTDAGDAAVVATADTVAGVAVVVAAASELPVPKSVPDFESCGAVWVTSAQLTALDDTDYRSPDPAFWFPAVTKGALFSHSDVSLSLPVSVRHMYMPVILLFVIDILAF